MGAVAHDKSSANSFRIFHSVFKPHDWPGLSICFGKKISFVLIIGLIV